MKTIDRFRTACVARLLGGAVCAALCALPSVALAHGDHGKPMYGGIPAEAGVFQGELVASGGSVTLYITEHGHPLSTAGATAKLTILDGAQRSETVLLPGGDNRLTGSYRVPAGPARAVATVTLADGRSGALRFGLH